MKLLVTAFDPFGGESINPASEALKKVQSTKENMELVKIIVPTVFHKSIETVISAIETERPDAVLCIGQAGGRKEITPERVAINIDDARICDNEGNQPIDEKIYEDGENAYFSTLPIKAIVTKLKEANLPATLSNTAGTFVCNHLMYGVLHWISKHKAPIRAGFIHIPFMTEQVVGCQDKPSLPLEDIVKGIEITLETIADYDTDFLITAGKEF